MIRMVKRRLIIPRGDTGSFSIPIIEAASVGDVAVFTIFDTLTRTKVSEKELTITESILTFEFTHNDTVNLKPGKYLWDIKFYKNPVYADKKLVNGDEIDSYYAGFELPVCEIRETGDNLLVSESIVPGALLPTQLDIISAALVELQNATGGNGGNNNSGSFTETDPTVPAWAKSPTKPTYTASEVGALPATTIIPDISTKADKIGTVLETTLSLGRKINTTIGSGSIALGNTVTASNDYAMAINDNTTAGGVASFSQGHNTRAGGNYSHAEGDNAIAGGIASHAEGFNTLVNGRYAHVEGNSTTANLESMHVQGVSNALGTLFDSWIPNTSYEEGQKVLYNNYGYICTVSNSDSGWVSSHWNQLPYNGKEAFVIGNGIDEFEGSNALTIDWDGTGHFMGDIYVGANSDGSGGTKVAKISDVEDREVILSGTSQTITAETNTRYLCGTLTSLYFTPSQTGICEVIFTSGSNATVVVLPNTVKMPENYSIEVNRIYEINILNGVYGAVMSWPVT